MALTDLLVALASNQKLYITLKDKEGNDLITFNAAGYESVESDLGSRVVKKITVGSPAEVSIVLEDATP
jgi:hypothetical protein